MLCPWASKLKISSTEIRNPRMMGFPEKMVGSATIRRSNISSVISHKFHYIACSKMIDYFCSWLRKYSVDSNIPIQKSQHPCFSRIKEALLSKEAGVYNLG